MDEEIEKKHGVFHIVGKVIKYVFFAAVLAMVVWLLLRSCWQSGTSLMKDYLWTDEAAQRFGRQKMTVNEYLDYNDNSTDRVFYIGNVRYTKELGQFQFMLRYNEKFILRSDKLSEKADKYSETDGQNERFCFVLCDNKGNKYTEYEYVTDSKSMYNFYKVAFSGVDVEDITSLTVRIYCVTGDEISYSDVFDTCTVWYSDGPVIKSGLSDDEKKAVKPTEKLKHYSVKLKPDSNDNTEDQK